MPPAMGMTESPGAAKKQRGTQCTTADARRTTQRRRGIATATVAAYASLGGWVATFYQRDRARFHIALVGAMMVAALALTDGLLALAGG